MNSKTNGLVWCRLPSDLSQKRQRNPERERTKERAVLAVSFFCLQIAIFSRKLRPGSNTSANTVYFTSLRELSLHTEMHAWGKKTSPCSCMQIVPRLLVKQTLELLQIYGFVRLVYKRQSLSATTLYYDDIWEVTKLKLVIRLSKHATTNSFFLEHREEITKFVEQANDHHPNTKFTVKNRTQTTRLSNKYKN